MYSIIMLAALAAGPVDDGALVAHTTPQVVTIANKAKVYPRHSSRLHLGFSFHNGHIDVTPHYPNRYPHSFNRYPYHNNHRYYPNSRYDAHRYHTNPYHRYHSPRPHLDFRFHNGHIDVTPHYPSYRYRYHR